MIMHAEHVSDELLQRHFDGELGAPELAPLEAHLGTCRVCSARRAAFGRLSEFVAQSAREDAAGVDFGGLFSRIEQGIDQASAKTAGDGKASVASVIPIRSRSRSLSMLTTLSAGLAAAAAVLLMVYQSGAPGRPGTTAEGVAPSATPAPQTATPTAPKAATPGHSEVVQVDFGLNAGTVFDIALADGSSTAVVWINDDE